MVVMFLPIPPGNLIYVVNIVLHYNSLQLIIEMKVISLDMNGWFGTVNQLNNKWKDYLESGNKGYKA